MAFVASVRVAFNGAISVFALLEYPYFFPLEKNVIASGKHWMALNPPLGTVHTYGIFIILGFVLFIFQMNIYYTIIFMHEELFYKIIYKDYFLYNITSCTV